MDRDTDKNNTIENYGKYLPYDADTLIDLIGCNNRYRKRLYKIRKSEKEILNEIMEDVRESLQREITG